MRDFLIGACGAVLTFVGLEAFARQPEARPEAFIVAALGMFILWSLR